MRKQRLHILLLAIFFLFQFFFVHPFGEFALNDDWVHTEILKHWVDTGEFNMNPFAGPSFYVPILYGAGLIKLFGFSFSILRISTLVFAFAALILFYKLLSDISKKPTLSFFATLALWLNPIFYNLSFTFMTDIPALFFIIAGMYTYYKGFKQGKPIYLFIGSILSVVGMYTRQTNILLLASAGIYALWILYTQKKLFVSGHQKPLTFGNILWSFGIPVIIATGIYMFLHQKNLLPPGTALHLFSDWHYVAKHVVWWTFYAAMYLGFFALPFAAGWFFKNVTRVKNAGWLPWVYIAGAVILAIVIRQTQELQFPYVLNIINFYGLGPMQGVMNGSLIPLLQSKIWGIITVAVAAGAGWIIYILVHGFLLKKYSKKQKVNSQLQQSDYTGFIPLFGIIFLLPILFLESFDRYFLPIFVVSAIILVQIVSLKTDPQKSQQNGTPGNNARDINLSDVGIITVLVVFACFSVSQTDFYVNWNKTRWEMANTILEQSNLDPHNIDAGYEWDGWHAFRSAEDAYLQGEKGPFGTPWWIYHIFVNNTQDYIVSWSPIPPYEVVEEREISGLNPNSTLYLLRKP